MMQVELRDALDRLGYDKVFDAILVAVETKSDHAIGISVEKLIMALTGVEAKDAPYLSAIRAGVSPTPPEPAEDRARQARELLAGHCADEDLAKDVREQTGRYGGLVPISTALRAITAALITSPAVAEVLEADDWSAGDVDSEGNELVTVRADGLLALQNAVKAASALATCCMARACYSPDELEEMARATKPTFDAALSSLKGDR
jgi:Xaa-Pro aminopeptidase